MGVVFSAVHSDLHRPVALKLMAPDLADDEVYRNRFLREAQALARLDSPHVVRVYDAGEHDGWLFIATELVPGGDLSQRIETQGALPIPEAMALVAGAADGLAAAHAAGVLHRDVKPSNVLLKTTRDGSVRAVLCDFGIATVEDLDATRTQGIIGTPAYLAPERHEGGGASVAADIYAMGCLLWACISGAAPYLGTPSQVLIGHLQGDLPKLPEVGGTDSQINRILELSMAKDPGRRFRNAAALANALRSTAEASAFAPDLAAGGGAEGDAVESTVMKTFVPSAPPAPERQRFDYDDADTRAASVPQAYAAPTYVPPARVPPPVATPPHNTAKRGRRRILVAVLVLLLLIGGVAGGVLLAGQNDPDDRSTAQSSDNEAPATVAPDSPSEASATESSTPAEPDGVVCWDGSSVQSARQCSAPTGVEGLAWMYPSFDRSECDRAGLPPPRLTVWQCWEYTPVGDRVLIRYSEWQSVALAEQSYASKQRGSTTSFERSPNGRVVRTVWRYDDVNREGRVTLSAVYRDWPFSVSIEGDSARAIDDGLDQLVVQRNPADVLTR